MEYRSNEIKAGLFVIASLIIFIGFLVIIAGLDAWSDKKIYRARFQYVGGIERGSVIRYAGLEVGKVKDIILPADNDPRVELLLEVDNNTRVREDSYAYLTTIGIMGAFYIEITPGTPDSPVIPTGALITTKDVKAFAQMSGTMGEATEEMTELITRVNDLLNIENRKHISSMIANFDDMSESNSKNIEIAFENVNRMTTHLDSMIYNLNNLVNENQSVISKSVVSMDKVLEQSSMLLAKLSDSMDEFDRSMLKHSSSFDEIVGNLTTVSRNLGEFSQRLKEQPWNLVRKTYPDERVLPEK